MTAFTVVVPGERARYASCVGKNQRADSRDIVCEAGDEITARHYIARSTIV